MSRHRDIRNLDYDEEYDEAYDETIYGHSYDEHEFGMSPSTVSQYMYNNSKENSFQFGAFFPTDDKIVEEDNDDKDSNPEFHRRDSSNFERPRLSSEDDVKLNSVLDEIRNVVGDHFSDAQIIQTILEHKFDCESSLNAVLQNEIPSAASSSQPVPLPTAKTAADVSRTSKRQRAIATNPVDRGGPSSSSSKHASSIVADEGAALPISIVTNSRKNFGGFKTLENGVANLRTNEVKGGNNEDLVAPVIEEKEFIPSVPKVSIKIRDKEVDVMKLYAENRCHSKELLNLVVVGHVDAGKSTLMGHLLYLQGNVTQRAMHKYEQESKKMGKQSFMYAWVLDDTEEERSRGITVDIAQRMFETESKMIGLLDAPGHRDFIPNMITGAARADVSLLVVDASTGGFEAGFESGGQTREHAILVKSLGVSQLAVAVNKLDTVNWSQNRFDEIKTNLRQFLKTVGFRDSDVVYVPCSGLTGDNLIVPYEAPELTSWYDGPTLIKAIDQLKVPERGFAKPVRMCIGDVYKGQGANMVVAGKLETGFTQTGDRLMLVPQNEIVSVKSIQADSGAPGLAFAGDHVTLNVTGVDSNMIHVGDFLSDPVDLVPQATRIEARIVVFNVMVPIIKGTEFYFHCQSVNEVAKLSKLVSLLHKSTGQVIKLKPRALIKNSTAVVELSFTRPLCVEAYKDYKELGRFMLRNNGVTVAAGMVTKIIKCTNPL